ncbi:MAG: twin-arginine translocase TatA/TatE family subunit [Terracidiphilus sp.]|jgi:sec-independent protein translocase protein TatB
MGMPPTIEVASLGFENSIILMVLALVVFGPRRLPEIGRRIGKIMYEIRKASNDFKFQMEEELRVAEDAERRKKEEERLSALPSSQQDAAVSPAPEATSTTSTESPYPDEVIYPPVTAAASEEPYPRILPPSIGEPVPAARPGKRSAQPKPPAAKKPVRSTKSKRAATKAPARAKKTRKTPGRRS